MKINLICPICNRSIVGTQLTGRFQLACSPADGHFYGTHAPTEVEARAILEKAQKKLVDALSAKIALPIEQRRHAVVRRRLAQLEYFARYVHDKFKRDIEQGYKTHDKEFAVDLLGKALNK